MAAFRIFHAWQSDRPANVCRTLIRRALDKAREQLENDLDVQDVVRNGVLIDQDTQGEAGSPSVAEMIFRKIRESDAFVADLTFTETRSGKPGSPNPNVLIEYGYALHALGDQRIIGVMNEEFGKPDDLPFDLVHKRWPIRYRLSGGGNDPATRSAELDSLSRNLATAIRAVVRNAGILETSAGVESAEPLIERILLHGELVRPGSGRRYEFPGGAKILLGLRSGHPGLSLNNLEAQSIAQKWLKPLAAARTDGSSWARVRNGAAVAELPRNDDSRVQFASILSCDGSIYGIDCYSIGAHENAISNHPFVPSAAVEEILVDGLANFLSVAEKGLNLKLPLVVDVALEGINEHFLAVDPLSFSDAFKGPYLVDRIEDNFKVDTFGADPEKVLRPFFERIYDGAGLQRP